MASLGRFVGRAGELTALVGALDQAIAGRTTAVLVTGEAGIGKTRLLEELERLAGARSVPVLWGRATTDEGAPPHWPWRQALRGWVAATDASVVRTVVGDAAPQLVRIVPELAWAPTDGPQPAPDDPDQRFALFEATGQLLHRLAAEEGLVLVLDDLHWADVASLRLLTHVARNLRDARLLLAGALRPAEAAQSGPVHDAVTAIAADSATIRLDLVGLTPDEVASHLTRVLGSEPDPATVTRVCERTAGNPLFVQEVGRLIATGAHGVPHAVAAAIGQRLAALAPRTIDALHAAAVIGVDINPALVADAAGLPVEAMVAHLDEALAAGLVSEPRSATGYRFAHDLIRECCLLELPALDRARLHLGAAEALGRTGRAGRLAEVAHHRYAALPLGDPSAAQHAATRAAEQAMAQLAFEEAARFYSWAITAAETADTDQRERARLYAEAARAHHHSHDGAAAIAAAETAVQLAQAVADPEVIATAVLALEDTSEPEWLTKVATWCDAALALLPDADSPVRARLLAQRAVATMLTGDLGGLDRSSLSALEVAERCDDPAALATALRARQLATSWPDGALARLELGDRMIDLGARTGDLRTASWGHLWRFDAYVQLGRIDDAEAELQRLEPVVEAARQPLVRFHLLRSRTVVLAGRGNFEAALAIDDEVLALAQRGGYMGAVMTSWAVRSLLSVLTGRRLVQPLDVPLDEAPPVFAAIARGQLAELAVAFGELDDAARLYREIQAFPRPPLPFLQITFDVTMAQLATALGERTAAEAAYHRLLPYADLHASGGAGAIATRGSVQAYLGVAAVGEGRLDAAIDHLHAAVAANTAAGLPPSTALSQCTLAEALVARARPGDHDTARIAALAARATADALGMGIVQQRVAVVLEKIGTATDQLSRREREVAALVGHGLTNRQIADSLHIAERTAENHVQHILMKLGFNTRSQIAAWVATPHR